MRRPAARDGQRGQALVETGIVIVLFVLLGMGIIEFGRAFMITNMITHATRDGARIAATWPTASRTSGAISSGDQTTIANQVKTEMQSAGITGLTVTVSQPTVSGIPMAQVQVSGTISYLFNLVASSFPVSRTVSFRDEGR
jgi:Flp pilus assembly protein TadG